MHALGKYYNDILSSSPRRFVVYAPIDQSGWGNKVRGFVCCFLIALATRRRLVVDEPLILDYFDPPDGIDWNLRSFRGLLRSKDLERKVLATHARPEERVDKVWDSFSTMDFDELYPEQVIVHHDGTSIADPLIANPRYADVWKSCEMDFSTKLAWNGLVTSYLLGNPTRRLVRQYEKQCAEMLRHPKRLKVGVQFRTFYDIGSPWMKYLEPFINNANERILAPLRQTNSLVLLVTTDSPSALERMATEIGRDGDVLVISRKLFHTGTTNTGLLRFLEKALKKSRLVPRDSYLDLNKLLPRAIRYRRHLNILADWYALGECDVLISTFTSFAAFGAARTGNKAVLWMIDSEHDYCGPLDDKHYGF